MSKENFIVGLDIGTTKICCIVAKKVEGKKIEIIGSGVVPSRGVQDGEVKNILHTSEDIRSAVEKAETKTGHNINEVFVGIAGAHVKSSIYLLGYTRQNSDKLIDNEDIKLLEEQVINLNTEPGEEIISYQNQEFFVDKKTPIKNDPKGMRGNRLEANFHVITGNATSTKNIEQCVKMAGLTLIDYDLEPLASAAAVLTDEQKEEGVCLVDIGGGTTDIAIFHNGIIRHTAIIPYAGEYITQMIQNKMKLRYESAKKLKENQNATSALYRTITENKILTVNNMPGMPPVQLSQRYYCMLVNACLEQIFNLVKNEISTSYYRNKLNAGIVITGGGAMIPDLKNFVEQLTGLHTQIGHPISRLSNLQDRAYGQTLFSTGIGLALLASDSYTDLIVDHEEYTPEEIIEKQEPKKLKEPKLDIASTNISWMNRIKGKIDQVREKAGEFLLDEEDIKEFEDINYKK